MQLEQIFRYVCWVPGFRKPFQPSESGKSHFYRSYDHKLTFTRITWSTITPSNDQIQNFDIVFRSQRLKAHFMDMFSFSCKGHFKAKLHSATVVRKLTSCTEPKHQFAMRILKQFAIRIRCIASQTNFTQTCADQ